VLSDMPVVTTTDWGGVADVTPPVVEVVLLAVLSAGINTWTVLTPPVVLIAELGM
jgi:hypothetical protein